MDNMNKKTALIIIIIFVLLPLTGCWSRVEIEERAIVTGIGIDKAGNNQVAITVEVIKPSALKSNSGGENGGGGGSGDAVLIFHGHGKDVFDALRKIEQAKGRRFYYTEMKVVILGETMARDNIASVIDWLSRHPMINLRTLVLVSQGPARKIIETKNPMEQIWIFALDKVVRGNERMLTSAIDLLCFLRTSTSSTTAPILTSVELLGAKKPDDEEAIMPGLRILPNGRAVFRSCKMIGILDETQTRGLLWVQGQISMGLMTVPEPQDHDEPLTLAIISAKSQIKPKFTDNDLSIHVKINEKSMFIESGPCPLDLNNPKTLAAIDQSKKAAIKQEVMAALDWARANKADIFGFGEEVRRKYPKQWPQMEKKWDEIFPTLKVVLEVDSHTQWTGLTGDPFHAHLK